MLKAQSPQPSLGKALGKKAASPKVVLPPRYLQGASLHLTQASVQVSSHHKAAFNISVQNNNLLILAPYHVFPFRTFAASNLYLLLYLFMVLESKM